MPSRPSGRGRCRPRDRPEKEIRGYRLALDLIHTSASDLAITPDLLRRLHSIIQDGSADAGLHLPTVHPSAILPALQSNEPLDGGKRPWT